MGIDLTSGLALATLSALTLTAAAVDLRRLIIPDEVNLALALSGLVAALLSPFWQFADALLGLLGGGALAFLLRAAHRGVRGIEGLGLGDVKFVAAGGAWSGLENLPAFLLVAALSGLAYAALRSISSRPLGEGEHIPFGPFLAGGLLVIGGCRILWKEPVYDLFLPA